MGAKAEWRRPRAWWPCTGRAHRELLQTHSVRGEAEPGSLPQVLGVPFPRTRAIGLLADDEPTTASLK